MAVLEKFITELTALQTQTALDSLTGIAESDKSEFGFGKATGRLEGLRLAGELLEKLLREQEAHERGVSGRGRGAAKAESG